MCMCVCVGLCCGSWFSIRRWIFNQNPNRIRDPFDSVRSLSVFIGGIQSWNDIFVFSSTLGSIDLFLFCLLFHFVSFVVVQKMKNGRTVNYLRRMRRISNCCVLRQFRIEWRVEIFQHAQKMSLLSMSTDIKWHGTKLYAKQNFIPHGVKSVCVCVNSTVKWLPLVDCCAHAHTANYVD